MWLSAGVDTCPECANTTKLAIAIVSAQVPEGGRKDLAGHRILELGQILKNASHSTYKQAKEQTG